MENIKLVIELILVAQFVLAVAIVFLFQKLKFFLDHYNANMKNMVDFVNKLKNVLTDYKNYLNRCIKKGKEMKIQNKLKNIEKDFK